jgi:PAS domain S-box-containing protein
MRSSDKKGGKTARQSGARRARSSKVTGIGGISPVPSSSSSIEPAYVSLTGMLETLKPHDHLCLIYESKEEWQAVIVPFISIGLKRGERCIYIVDTSTADGIRKYLSKVGVDVAAAEKSGQLSILHETEAYTREGSFDPDKMIALLISETEKAIAEGYPALRVTGEMTWVLRGHPGSERLLEYEAKLNHDFFPKYPCLAICQYDRWKFAPEVIKGVIVTHPLLVRSARIYRNFYYMSPEEFLSEKRAEIEVQRWLDNVEREHQIQEKYLTVLEDMDEGYYEIGLDGNWTFFNDTFCNSLGYSREELTGMNYRAVTFEEDADALYRIFEESYRTGKVAKNISFRAIRKDGSVRSIETSAFPVRSGEGKIIGFRGIGRDITERKQLEEELQESERHHRTLVENAIEGIVVIQDGKIKFVNPLVAVVSGYSTEELQSMSLKDLVYPDDEKAVIESLSKLAAPGTLHIAPPFRFRTKGGEIRLIEAIVVSITWDDKPANLNLLRDLTEVKRAEETLADEASRRRILFGNARDGIVVLDEDARVVEANQRFAEMLGYSIEEVRKLHTWDWDTKWTREELLKMGYGVDEAGMLLETRHRRKDGTVYDVDISINSAVVAGRKLIFCVCRDVTERKRAEETLRDREARFRYLFEHSQIANALVGLDGKIIDVNQVAAELYGYEKSEIIGMHLLRFIAPESKAKVAEAFASGLLHAETKAVEVEVATKGGRRTFLFPGGYHTLVEAGKEIGFLISAIDITERKKAEDTLADEATRRRILFDNARDGIVVLDESAKVVEANQRFAEMLGYTPGEVRKLHVWDWDVLTKRAELLEMMQTVNEAGASFETRHRRRDGTVFDVEISANSDVIGGKKLIFCVCRDVTERKRAEEEMQHLNVVLRAIRNINQLIAKRVDRDSLLKGVCENLVSTRGYYNAWIALLDESGRLVTVVEAGLGKSFQRMIERLKRGELPNCGQKVLKKSGALLIGDPASACIDCPLAKDYSGRGGMSIRLEYSGKVYGLMSVSAPLGFLGRKEEQSLFEEVAGDIAFALYSMEQEEERRRAEEALQISEQNFHDSIENSPLGIRIADEDGKSLYINRALLDMWGYSSLEEMEAVPRRQRLNPQSYKEHRERVEKRKRGEEAPSDYEMSIVRSDGQVRHLLASRGELLWNGERQFQVLYRDITEQKLANEELKASEARYRELADSITDVFFAMDRDLRYTHWNKASEELMGIAAKDALGKHLSGIFPDTEETKAAEKEYLKVLGTGKPRSFVNEYTLNDKKHWFDINAYPTETGVSVFVRDITERKQMEEALRRSEQNFRDSIENSPFGIRVMDKNGETLYINQALLDIWGYSSLQEMEAVPREQRYTPQSYNEHLERLEKRKRGEPAPVTYDVSIVRSDGEVRYLSVSRGELLWNGEKRFQIVYQDITERERAEEALADEALRRRMLMDNSIDGISVLDENCKLVEANKRFADMLGYSPEEVREFHVWDWDTDHTREEVLEMARTVDEVGQHFETRHRRKDGTYFDVELSNNGVVVAGKKLIFCVSRDITERKKAEEALRRSEQNFRDSIENSPLGIRILDKDGKTLYVNRALLDMWGYGSLEELEAVPAKKRYTPESYAEHMNRTGGRRWGDPDVLSYEVSIVCSDGQVRHISASTRTLLWDGEKRFQLVYQDITERKRIEEELRTSRDYLGRILNSMVEVLMVVDTNFNIININRTFLDYYGGKRKDIIGRKCYEVLHRLSEPCSTAQHRCPLRTVLKAGKPFHAEHVYEAAEGRKFTFEISMFPLVDPAGNVEAVVEMQHDITESKRAEDEKGQLEQKAQVASRLASVGEMAAGIAHEINNPLTSVIGYSQLLLDRDDIPKDMRMDLKAIDEGAQRVAGIIKRLLTFARQTRPERTLVNVNELVTNTLDLRAYHLRTNNIKVTTELSTDLPVTTADAAQLQQVFLNIIVNAETAMKLARGKGKLLIKTEEANGAIQVSFKDNGPGIARENLARIFDPFFTTREVGEGTGLGLSICHGIMVEHKGKLWAESELGKGATFIVELPIVVEPAQFAKVEPAGKKPQKVPKARILVVDDEPSTLEFLSRLLGAEGHEVETVSNAAEAFEMVKAKRYGLILLDIKMPGASGIELYGRMQKIAQSFAERVIFITGDIMGTDTEAFLSKTKAPYVTKPFDIKQLKKKIEHFLTGNQ